MAKLFFSYSHVDEKLRDQLEKHLAPLRRGGVIDTWHDRRIGAGHEFGEAIDQHVNEDDIILLLVSPDFLASDYCYDREMMRAMARHEAGEATVIPVILRSCLWHETPFGKLNATPPDGLPITQWSDRDQAYTEVAKAVRAAAQAASRHITQSPALPPYTAAKARAQPSRSSSAHAARALGLLRKIYQAWDPAAGTSPFFVMEFDNGMYVQVSAELGDSNEFLLEAVSHHFAPDAWKQLGQPEVERLLELGFQLPKRNQNFAQLIRIQNDGDLIKASSILGEVIEGVFGIEESREPKVLVEAD